MHQQSPLSLVSHLLFFLLDSNQFKRSHRGPGHKYRKDICNSDFWIQVFNIYKRYIRQSCHIMLHTSADADANTLPMHGLDTEFGPFFRPFLGYENKVGVVTAYRDFPLFSLLTLTISDFSTPQLRILVEAARARGSWRTVRSASASPTETIPQLPADFSCCIIIMHTKTKNGLGGLLLWDSAG